MPLYEYGCRDCGTRIEVMRKTSERLSPAVCPACGAAAVLVMSAPGFVGAGAGASSASPSLPPCEGGSGPCCGGGGCHH